MKKQITLSVFTILLSSLLFAQNTINLNINHKLGADDFAFNQSSKNNLSNDFDVKRLQYYVSGVTLVHDGGTETQLDSIWMLVDASLKTTQELGTFNITNIEAIKFHIGIEQDFNHGDPTLFHASHPLSPKSPSMHWGWTSGYRFIALEGKAGSSLSNAFELHGLGDKNYHETTVSVSASATNNIIDINLYADYTKALEDIDVSSGTIEHSESGDAKKAIENFRDFVFSGFELIQSTASIDGITSVDIYPVPAKDGKTNLQVNTLSKLNFNAEILNIQGKSIKIQNKLQTNIKHEIEVNESGVYFIKITGDGINEQMLKFINK